MCFHGHHRNDFTKVYKRRHLMHNQVEVAMCPSRHMNMGTLYAEVLQLP